MSPRRVYTSIPKTIRKLFERPPLIFGESIELYFALVVEIAAQHQPADHIEWCLIRDIVNLEWHIKRLHRYMAAKLCDGQIGELSSRLEPYVVTKIEQQEPISLIPFYYPSESAQGRPPLSERRLLAEKCLSGDVTAKKSVASKLADRKLEHDPESLMLAAFGACLPQMDELSRMLAVAEARRDRIIKSLDRRRLLFAALEQAPAPALLSIGRAQKRKRKKHKKVFAESGKAKMGVMS